MKGESMTTIVGGDRDSIPLHVPWAEPKPKQTGLDWAKISPPADEAPAAPTTVSEARQQQMDEHRANLDRVEQIEGRSRSRERTPARTEPPPASKSVQVTAPPVEDTPADITTSAGVATTTGIPTWLDSEILAVADILRRTQGSTDMVVAACRSAVIASADALRGAALRAAEGPRQKTPGKDPGKVPRPPSEDGQPRIEVQRPQILPAIRRRYVDEGASIETIGAELGMSPNTVSRILHRNGIDVRTTAEGTATVHRLVQQRLADLGVTSMQVRRWAVDHGIEVSDRGKLALSVIDRYEDANR